MIYMYLHTQGRRTSQCQRAMALAVFCLALKLGYKNLPRNFPISFEASKWHWLILASIGALGNITIIEVILTRYISLISCELYLKSGGGFFSEVKQRR